MVVCGLAACMNANEYDTGLDLSFIYSVFKSFAVLNDAFVSVHYCLGFINHVQR